MPACLAYVGDKCFVCFVQVESITDNQPIIGMTTSRQMLPMATTSALPLLLLVLANIVRRGITKARPQP